ncbi:peptidase U32 family protein [Paenibacillus cymbidii]|uniref:peptidase U32 family protein n=1 Tax=Paenibacillus cymbidii TaxID=1639034 RepID=UPI00107FF89D|nr:peptidase U32 family protein [Paenibacillus cymbidii]
MATKSELLVTAGSVREAEALVKAGADAVSVGSSRYGVRVAGEMAAEQIGEAIKIVHSLGSKVYVLVNNIMSNGLLPELADYIKQVADYGADALVFGDPAVLIACRQAGVKLPLHWNAEMTTTNYASANYWAGKGATRAVLARELNMEQVLEFKRHAALEVQVQVHGMTNIYHSKRPLVANYFQHQGKESGQEKLGAERGLFVIEAERRDEKYPIFEDANGTHMMSAEDICMLESVHELIEGGIDSLRIEGLMKSLAYNEAVVRAYRTAIDAYAADPAGYEFNPEWQEPIEALQPADRPLSFGFFYKDQVY